MREIIINKNDADQRLDKFLSKRFKNMPKSLMYKYIRTRYIKVNNKKCEISTMLKEGDVLKLFIKDEFFDDDRENEESYEFLKAPLKLDIIYEDENILIINKKPGLIVHPDKSYHFDSLIARVLHYLYEKGEYNPKNDRSFAPATVNRLDRNTGGIVIAAKNAEALRIMNAKIKSREIKKLYLCMVQGKPRAESGTVSGYLEKNESKNKVRIFSENAPGRKYMETKYRVIKSVRENSLLEVDLITGRTHQIRASMAKLGYPLLGDTKYGYKKKSSAEKEQFKYQALYAYRITFEFQSDAGILQYLDGRSFEADSKSIWFINFI